MTSGEEANLIVFYPLYPMLIRALSGLLTSVEGLYGAVGIGISLICAGLSAVMVVRLAERYLPAKDCLWVLAAWLLYPYAFFSAGVYTESLFMLLSLSCLTML